MKAIIELLDAVCAVTLFLLVVFEILVDSRPGEAEADFTPRDIDCYWRMRRALSCRPSR